MILYLDASALVKRYVAEPGSPEVNEIISTIAVVGTALVTRAEVGAALAKGVRLGALNQEEAMAALHTFRDEWSDLVRIQVTEAVIARAEMLAWEQSLRGYDAVHLAAASIWQDAMSDPVIMATFDRHLWVAARRIGLIPFPEDLSDFLKAP
ncbi:MAG: type II toxin-antitoxin system VapC family toxin [Anaerolineae bacterium]|nr:type II toxin-antitoxin system VapC family toxin [Anaerolineae bacterium]